MVLRDIMWLLILVLISQSSSISVTKFDTLEQCESVGNRIIGKQTFIIDDAYCMKAVEK